ncbi:hypothetical protein BG006_006981 [Podila minutissima]|uniref:Uncharacterized protein n=1 Tax=Podila minutissima TaxID=64525 RepID=A0A9P5VL16_9FUNG|nr:hypothetical protein BG006_006981 [Podila minutissima]
MKILSISLGLAALVMTAAAAAAQDQVKVTPEQVAAFDPMAPLDVNVYYAWATTGTEAEIAAKAELMADSLSEVQFRARLLARFKTDIAAPPEFRSEDLPAVCQPHHLNRSARHLGYPGPDGRSLHARAAEMAKKFLDLVDTSIDDPSKLVAVGVDLSLAALESTLVALGAGTGLSGLLQPLASAIGAVRQVAKNIDQCLGGVSTMSVDDSYCYSIADLYRGLTQDVQNNTPALPASSSEELKRLAAGASTVLSLIAQNSIAAKNEDLFSVRSIFAADVLDEYRFELQRVAEEEKNEEWKQYAQLGLGVVSGMSNALEACVRVVSTPEEAREELAEDLALKEKMNEYEDEDAEQ